LLLWIPLRRQPAVRMSLAAGFLLGLAGLAVTTLTWGFLEGFFGIYFARKVNWALGHSGTGWFAPGTLAFALFNGGIHLIAGQGFLTSFASGYAIVVVPAITGNAWGGTLVQTLTNAVGRPWEKPPFAVGLLIERSHHQHRGTETRFLSERRLIL